MCGVAVHHADDGYSRRGNFGGSLVHSTFSTYSPDDSDTSVYGPREMGDLRGQGQCTGLKVVKSCSYVAI